MLIGDIKERLSKDPFEPFRIRGSSGESYEITRPFLIALMKSKLFIAFPNSDRWAELSYLHVAALESATNGHGKRGGRGRHGRS
ncbi:hypothetical protein PHYC_01263 [Phycisphaerales bacterium]|nr:hypothetical protein PHYC_01263 [Phycisphaerales bacterium]